MFKEQNEHIVLTEPTTRAPDERIYLYQFLNVLDKHTHKHLGYLSDFSTNGLMFITGLPIAEKNVIDICISGSNAKNEPVFIEAQIITISINPNLNPELNCIRCQFLKIDAENRAFLEKTGQSLSFDSRVEINREIYMSM